MKEVASDTPRQQWGILSHKHIIHPSVCEHPSPASPRRLSLLWHSSLCPLASLTARRVSGYRDTEIYLGLSGSD